MNEPPKTVGAPSELADAEEMPGCVVALVKSIYFIPYFFLWELPTVPLDMFALIYDRFGKWAAILYALSVVLLIGLACRNFWLWFS